MCQSSSHCQKPEGKKVREQNNTRNMIWSVWISCKSAFLLSILLKTLLFQWLQYSHFVPLVWCFSLIKICPKYQQPRKEISYFPSLRALFDFNYFYTCLGNQIAFPRGLKGEREGKKRHGKKETEKGETKVCRRIQLKRSKLLLLKLQQKLLLSNTVGRVFKLFFKVLFYQSSIQKIADIIL